MSVKIGESARSALMNAVGRSTTSIEVKTDADGRHRIVCDGFILLVDSGSKALGELPRAFVIDDGKAPVELDHTATRMCVGFVSGYMKASASNTQQYVDMHSEHADKGASTLLSLYASAADGNADSTRFERILRSTQNDRTQAMAAKAQVQLFQAAAGSLDAAVQRLDEAYPPSNA